MFDDYNNRATMLNTDLTNNAQKATYYTYNRANQLVREETTLNGTTDTDYTYRYDAGGNLLAKEKTLEDGTLQSVMSNTFDKFNRVASTTVRNETNNNNVTTSFAYDANDHRISKTTSGTTTNQIWNGDNIICDDVAGTIKTYIQGNDTEGMLINDSSYDSLPANSPYNDNFYANIYNGRGDVVQSIKFIGTSTNESYQYDAFGNNKSSATYTISNPYRYSGEYTDSETGLYYLNARMYDPLTARFLQEDTYAGDKNDPLSLNRYTYCDNEPLMYSDPTGHWKIIGSGAIKEDESDTVESLIMMTTGNLDDIKDVFRGEGKEVELAIVGQPIDITYLVQLMEFRENSNSTIVKDTEVYKNSDAEKQIDTAMGGSKANIEFQSYNMIQVTYELKNKTYGNWKGTGWVEDNSLLAKQDKDAPIQIVIQGNNINVHVMVGFNNDAYKKLKGSDKTYRDLIIEGITNWEGPVDYEGKQYNLNFVIYELTEEEMKKRTTNPGNLLSDVPPYYQYDFIYFNTKKTKYLRFPKEGDARYFDLDGVWHANDGGYIELSKDDILKNAELFRDSATHEFGHALGLADAYAAFLKEGDAGKKLSDDQQILGVDSNDIMYGSYRDNKVVTNLDRVMVIDAFVYNESQYFHTGTAVDGITYVTQNIHIVK